MLVVLDLICSDGAVAKSNCFVAVGISDSIDAPWGNNGEYDGIIVKYDCYGNVVWTQNLGGSEFDGFGTIIPANCGFVISGFSNSIDGPWGNNGMSDGIIMKFEHI